MPVQSVLGDKSLAYAKRIAQCFRYLRDKKKETVMSKQLLRSGTSIGANVREGQYAQSKKDFISKMNRRQTECKQVCLICRCANRWSSERRVKPASTIPSRDRGGQM